MVYILITLAVFLLDTNVKNYIEHNFQIGEKKDLLRGKVIVKRQYNSGFCLNVLDDKIDLVRRASAIVFSIIVFVFLLILPKKGWRLQKLGLSLCIGGAASNLRDRYKNGKVLDYFSFNIKPIKHIVFNLADIFIFIGSFFILLSSLFHTKIETEGLERGEINDK